MFKGRKKGVLEAPKEFSRGTKKVFKGRQTGVQGGAKRVFKGSQKGVQGAPKRCSRGAKSC